MRITKDWIQQICFEEMIPLWDSMPETFPEFIKETEKSIKTENEAYLNEFLSGMQKKMTRFPTKKSEQIVWKREMEKILKCFLAEEKILGILAILGDELYASFERETKHFIKKVRNYDEHLEMEDIWQAMRNYFIYAMITDFQGKEQNCSDPAFAYSLLYPYTDNFIDSSEKSTEQKTHFNRMIETVLMGEPYHTEDELEEKTCQLLLLIQNSYDLKRRKEISELLLFMLEAQKESICQQKGEKAEDRQELSEEKILKISAYKGSISVLNDYILAEENPCPEEAEFYLKFGFILQLSDDLQDIAEDKKEGSHTIMTRAEESNRLEQTVNRFLHFTYQVMESFAPRNPCLMEFAMKNCLLMILSTIITNAEYFSTEYLEQVEKYLLFSGTFLRKFQKVQPERALNHTAAKERQMQMIDLMISE